MSLPRGWTTARLEEVVAERVSQAEPTAGSVPYIDIGAIDRERKSISETQSVTASTAPTRARQWVKAGDVLVSMTRPNLNAVALVPEDLDGAVASTGFDVLRPLGVLPQWIFYRVRSHAFVQDVCEGVQGVVYPAIRPADVRRHRLPIPPAAEQARIVENVDSMLSRLDAAVASLEAAQRKLKAYRGSVLKDAVEGRLVPSEAELAQKEGRSYERADVLLERILTERRRRWEEAELAKMNAAGRAPKDDRWKAKYGEPEPLAVGTLPSVPDGWCWTRLDQLGHVTGGLTKNAARDTHAKRHPYLRVANVYSDRLVLDDIKDIGVDDGELPRLLLRRGDLLVVEGNGSVGQIGRVALWDGSVPGAVHQNHLIKVRFTQEPLERWVLTWLLSPGGRRAIERVASSTSGLHTLSISKVQNLLVPLPPVDEQVRVLEVVDQFLSIVDTNAASITASRRRSARLRQSVLKWAFEGRLVDQDPRDESADALLARIRGELAAMPIEPKQKRARKLKAAS